MKSRDLHSHSAKRPVYASVPYPESIVTNPPDFVIPLGDFHDIPVQGPRALNVNTFPPLTAEFVGLRDLTSLAVGNCTYTDFIS